MNSRWRWKNLHYIRFEGEWGYLESLSHLIKYKLDEEAHDKQKLTLLTAPLAKPSLFRRELEHELFDQLLTNLFVEQPWPATPGQFQDCSNINLIYVYLLHKCAPQLIYFATKNI